MSFSDQHVHTLGVTPNHLSILSKQSRFVNINFSENGYIWCSLKQDAPVCFSTDLVSELLNIQQVIQSLNSKMNFKYQIISSDIPNIFSLGGDLSYFLHMIETQDVQGLTNYAYSTVDLIHSMATGHNQGLHTISAIDGQAYGGGFECALAADYVVATKSSRFALPEIMFNMIPGMGAYQLLGRRVSKEMAKKIIMSGKVYTSEEMLDLGVIDAVVESDELNNAVADYMHTYENKQNSLSAIRQLIDVTSPISKDELYQVADIWVDHALKLNNRDKTIMRMYSAKQAKKHPANVKSSFYQQATAHH